MRAVVDTARILVIEDSPDLLSLLERLLRENGWEVQSACDGESGLASALRRPPDAAIIDVGLPRRNGLEVTAELRRHGLLAPVLMLTALNSVSDRVNGLDAGADDYLAKPFDSDELLARVRALLRRSSVGGRAEILRVGELTLDPVSHDVWRGERQLALTQREYAVLEYLMRRAETPVTRPAIAAQVWTQGNLDLETTNIVDVYVAYLRRKLDLPEEEPMLVTVRGVGYALKAPVASAP